VSRVLPMMLWLCVSPLSFVRAAQSDASQTTINAAISRVRESIEQVRDAQQALPAPASDAERLVRMGELDQAPRNALSSLDMASLSGHERQAIWAAVEEQTREIDADNRSRLLSLVPAEGWFSISRYGRDAARAAFFIVQHADQSLWRRFLPKIEGMVHGGEAEGPSFALMYDRLAISESRPQRYGSQMGCEGSRYIPLQPVEDLQNIDARRKAIGLSPYADYLKIYASMRC
jgi:hypothetical protein